MHNCDNTIKYSTTISSLVGVYESLSYESDLKSASLLNTAVQKLPPNLKESWSLFTVTKYWVKPTLLDFNDWLKEKAEAHDLMKQTSSKARTEDNTNSVVKTKVASGTFAANTQTKGTQGPTTSAMPPSTRCIVFKGNHRFWECRVFKEKSPSQRAKVVAEAKLCFSCLDDYLDSVESPEMALNRSKELVHLLHLGGFKLSNFVSNIPDLAERIDGSAQSSEPKVIVSSKEETMHVLGLKWYHNTDTLDVSRGTNSTITKSLTQRLVLSLVSKVYDPIALVAPFTVGARLILKDIWRVNGQILDDELPKDTVDRFLPGVLNCRG